MIPQFLAVYEIPTDRPEHFVGGADTVSALIALVTIEAHDLRSITDCVVHPFLILVYGAPS